MLWLNWLLNSYIKVTLPRTIWFFSVSLPFANALKFSKWQAMIWKANVLSTRSFSGSINFAFFFFNSVDKQSCIHICWTFTLKVKMFSFEQGFFVLPVCPRAILRFETQPHWSSKGIDCRKFDCNAQNNSCFLASGKFTCQISVPHETANYKEETVSMHVVTSSRFYRQEDFQWEICVSVWKFDFRHFPFAFVLWSRKSDLFSFSSFLTPQDGSSITTRARKILSPAPGLLAMIVSVAVVVGEAEVVERTGVLLAAREQQPVCTVENYCWRREWRKRRFKRDSDEERRAEAEEEGVLSAAVVVVVLDEVEAGADAGNRDTL